VRNALLTKIAKPYEQLQVKVWNDMAPLLLNDLKNNPSTSLELNELNFVHQVSHESISIIAETSKLLSLNIGLTRYVVDHLRDEDLGRKLEEVLQEKALLPSFGLKHLQFNVYDESIFTLPYFAELEELTLNSPSSIITSKTLYSYQSIQKLTISRYNHPLDVSLLSNIRDLVLEHCNDVTDVSALRNNYSITIRDCRNINDYSTGFGVNSSKITVIMNRIPDGHLKINIAQFSKLKEITISNDFYFSRVEGMITGEIPNTLQYCNLHNIFPSQPLHFANIRNLHVNNIASLTNLNGLGSSRQIMVEISGCDNIIDFSALKYVPHVIINNCKGFKDCMQLEGVKHLQC
jgi:hypothetical protein